MMSGRRFAAHEKAESGGQGHNKRTGTGTVSEGQPERQEMRGSTVIGVALRTSVLMILLCGLVYPLVSTGVAQVLFPQQANGSMLRDAEGGWSARIDWTVLCRFGVFPRSGIER